MESPMDRSLTPFSWMLTPQERASVASLRTTRSRAQMERLMVLGIHGADEDGTPPSPVERLTQLHEVLTNDEARARLSNAEVEAFRGELAEMFAGVRAGSVDGIERTDTEAMRRIGACVIAARDEMAARATAAQEADAEIDAIAREAGLAAEGEGEEGGTEGEGTEGAEGGDAEGTEAEGAEGTEGGDAAEGAAGAQPCGCEASAHAAGQHPVEASASGPLAIPSLRALNERQPHLRSDATRVVVGDRQGADIIWLPTNERVTDAEFAERVSDYAAQNLGAMPMGHKTILGQRRTIADNAQVINSRSDSAEAISRKLELAVDGALDPRNWRDGDPGDALVASGGWGPPAPVVYDIPVLADADRSVRACLPSVGADRGGLTFVRPPSYASITQGGPGTTTAATGIWTNTTDTTPGGTVKSKQTVANPASVTRQLDAVYMQLQFGVLQARSFPELVRSWTQNTEAAWADEGDRKLLDLIEGFSITKTLTQAALASATRDFLAMHISLASQERRRQRMRPDAMLRLMYPSWVEDLVVIDLLRSGTSFVDTSPQVVARSYIREQLARANINSCPLRTDSTVTKNGGATRSIQAEVTATDFNELPTIARSYLFHEGAFVVADGGAENLGIVRDADLVNTNDFRIFSESFETVLDRGIWAYVTDVYLCPSGTAGAAVDLTNYCGGGS